MNEITEKLLAILACPDCKGRLVYNPRESSLDCSQSQLRFPIESGIPILLSEEARPYESAQGE